MNGLELFVRRLVEKLRDRDPAGVPQPLTVKELRQVVMPYRVYRNALHLTSLEDYDLLLLRLCAEEGGYARTTPSEAADRCRAEVAGPNPDLGLVAALDDVRVEIDPNALGRVSSAPAPEPVAAPAETVAPTGLPLLPLDAPEPPSSAQPLLEERLTEPAAPELAPPPVAARGAPRPSRPVPSAPAAAPPAARCPRCREVLPRGRRVVFCPFCGGRIDPLRCSRCGTELDPAWRHCITCGYTITSDGANV